MNDRIIYRHWKPGDDDDVLAFLPNTDENWYRHKFDDLDESLEPEGICLAFINDRVVGHVIGESTSLFVEEKVQEFGIVSALFVAPDIRRQGIATGLMRYLHTYFEKKGYRGSILETDTQAARQLYLKIGYQQVTRELRTELQPKQGASELGWMSMNNKYLRTLHQLEKDWLKQIFPVWWVPEVNNIDHSNINDYRVLSSGKDIIGYVKWSQPSMLFPHGRICDPIVPYENPTVVVESLQTAISDPLVWDTCEGSKYEKMLDSLGCLLIPMLGFTMLLSFDLEIDLTNLYRSLQ